MRFIHLLFLAGGNDEKSVVSFARTNQAKLISADPDRLRICDDRVSTRSPNVAYEISLSSIIFPAALCKSTKVAAVGLKNGTLTQTVLRAFYDDVEEKSRAKIEANTNTKSEARWMNLQGVRETEVYKKKEMKKMKKPETVRAK